MSELISSNSHIEIRKSMVSEAISLTRGEWPNKRIFHEYYSFKDYKIGFFIPGKESTEFTLNKKKPSIKSKRDYQNYEHADDTFINKEVNKKGWKGFKVMKTEGDIKKINQFDCGPLIKNGSERLSGPIIPESFNDLIIEICDNNTKGEVINLVGLLKRMVNLDDHCKSKEKNYYRYSPSVLVKTHNINLKRGSFPLVVLLYYLELIALNEDIKYHAGGYENRLGWDKPKQGRYNNIYTIIHIIAVKLKLIPPDDIINKFLRSSVSPITKQNLKKFFP